MKNVIILLFAVCALMLSNCQFTEPQTFCNPIDISYRFQPNEPSRREAADPVIIFHKDHYFLFASKSGGYWYSKNMLDWQFVESTGLPIEDYAPAVVEIQDKLFFTAFNSAAVYTTDDPFSGNWQKCADIPMYADPAFFLDDDGKLYMYDGCSNNGSINVQELASYSFQPYGERIACFYPDHQNRGWERQGDNNEGLLTNGEIVLAPWDEGAWMTKYNDVYYLQYSAPGTQFKSYADGVYTSNLPVGPFNYANYSPFSYKPGGFMAGAGHGCTFQDEKNNFWRIITMTISIKHMFERRLGIYPAGFDQDGQMFCNTYFADYPQKAPLTVKNPWQSWTGWMLLSFKKDVQASSSLPYFTPDRAVDEECRTWWSAATGDSTEWLQIDLGKICRVEAIQINFADQETRAYNRDADIYQQYTVLASADSINWQTLIDCSQSKKDSPHHYVDLAKAVQTRYIKLQNKYTPAQGKLAVSGLRIFGNAQGNLPALVETAEIKRNLTDPCQVIIDWPAIKNADGYVIRYGISPEKLYNSIQIYDTNTITINSLNAQTQYFLTIDSFNGSGVQQNSKIFQM